jgi:hypothetical protein
MTRSRTVAAMGTRLIQPTFPPASQIRKTGTKTTFAASIFQ